MGSRRYQSERENPKKGKSIENGLELSLKAVSEWNSRHGQMSGMGEERMAPASEGILIKSTLGL